MAEAVTEGAAALQALQGDHRRALETVCALLVRQGHLFAQVVCPKPNEPAECLATRGPAPAPPWIGRELQRNRGLRAALREGTAFDTREYAVWPLFVHGRPAGALLVGKARGETREVPEALRALLSSTLEARARQRQLSAELRQARAEVRRLQAAETHLLKRLALARHDLKAPLVPVKGYQDMMLRGMGGPLTATQKRYVERSKESVDRLRDLIDYRLRNPAIPVVDLAQVATEAAGAAARPFRVDAPVDPCWVLARPAALKSALTTWVRALAATAARGAELSLEIARGADGWVVTPHGDPYATLPVRAAQRCAALFAACGGQLAVTPSGVRAELPFDPRVEVVAADVSQAVPSPRSSTVAAAPLGAGADPG